MENKIVAISLFSGVGGLDIASFMSDIPNISSLGIEKDCIEILKANDIYGNAQIILGNLHKVDNQVFKCILEKNNVSKFIEVR